MQVEVVEFYPMEPNRKVKCRIHGTLHIYLPEYDLDIRGIYVEVKGNKSFFQMPNRKVIDPDTKKPIRYPYIDFCNRVRHEEFMASVKQAGEKYIIGKFLK